MSEKEPLPREIIEFVKSDPYMIKNLEKLIQAVHLYEGSIRNIADDFACVLHGSIEAAFDELDGTFL